MRNEIQLWLFLWVVFELNWVYVFLYNSFWIDFIFVIQGRLSKEEIERIANNDENFNDEDAKQKDRISAKNGFNMKTTIDDEKMADKISADDKKLITDKCDDSIKWLNANQLAKVEEFQEKQKEVEAVCNPIITKLDESAGGAPDMRGIPAGAASGGSGSGPTIKDLD